MRLILILTLTIAAILTTSAACTSKTEPAYPRRLATIEDPQVLFEKLRKVTGDYEDELVKFEGYLRGIAPTFLPLYDNEHKSNDQIDEQRKLQREIATRLRVVINVLNKVSVCVQPILRYSLKKECPQEYEDKVMDLLLAKLRGVKLPKVEGKVLSAMVLDPLPFSRVHPMPKQRVLGAFQTQINLALIGMMNHHYYLRR